MFFETANAQIIQRQLFLTEKHERVTHDNLAIETKGRKVLKRCIVLPSHVIPVCLAKLIHSYSIPMRILF